MWFIYVLRDPNTFAVRYVGFTHNCKKRLCRHMSDARHGSPYPVHRWIRSLTRRGDKPEMLVIETGCGDGDEAERKWVIYYRERCPNLLNIRDGGIPNASLVARLKTSETLRGRIFTQEHRRKISEAKTGVARNDRDILAARCRDMAEANRGRKMNLSESERRRRRENGKRNGREIVLRMWATMSDEERIRRSELARVQMKRIWAERKNANYPSNA